MFNFFKKNSHDLSFHNRLLKKVGDHIIEDPFLKEKNGIFFEEWFDLGPDRILVRDEEQMSFEFSQFMNSFIYEFELESHYTVIDHIIDNCKDVFSEDEIKHLIRIRKNFYSVFDVETVEKGIGLTMRDLLSNKIYKVSEISGSYKMEPGCVIFARVTQTKADEWVMLYNDGVFKEPSSYIYKRIFSNFKNAFKDTPLSSRFLHERIFKHAQKKDGEAQWVEGANLAKRIKKMFKAIYGKKFKMYELDEELLKLDFQKELDPQLKKYVDLIRSKFPPYEIEKIVKNFYDYAFSLHQKKASKEESAYGVIEKMLMQDLTLSVQQQLNPIMKDKTYEELREMNSKLQEKWLHTPQRELRNKTPHEAIMEERKQLGNPDTEIHIKIISQMVGKYDDGAQAELNAIKDKAVEYFKAGQYAEALKLFKQLVDAVTENHVDLFNMAICYYNLSNLKQASECVKKSLKMKPDYQYAQDLKNHIDVSMLEDEIEIIVGKHEFLSKRDVKDLFALLEKYKDFLFDSEYYFKPKIKEDFEKQYYDFETIYVDAIMECLNHKLYDLAEKWAPILYKNFDQPCLLTDLAEAQFLNGKKEEAIKNFYKAFEEDKYVYGLLNLSDLYKEREHRPLEAKKLLMEIRSRHENGEFKLDKDSLEALEERMEEF